MRFFAATGGVLLSALFASTAAAQVQCNATAQPVTVRAGGAAELLGDVLLFCSGGTAPVIGTTLPVVNIVVTLNLNATSRVLSGTATEALLFIDDPPPGLQRPCAPSEGNTVCSPLTALAGGQAGFSGSPVNVFQGVQRSANAIAFLGVPIFAPGTTSRLIRMKNLRGAVPETGLPNGQVTASVTVEGTAMALPNSPQVLGFAQTAITFSARNAAGNGPLVTTATGVALPQCTDWNRDLAANSTADYNNDRSFTVRFSELIHGAFKSRDINALLFSGTPFRSQNWPAFSSGYDPSFDQRSTESGFFNFDFPSTNGLNRAGRADSGTRLRLVFSNVPTNVKVFVSAHALRRGTYGCAGGQCSDSGDTASTTAAYGVVTDASGNNQSSATQPVNPLSAAEVWNRAPSGGVAPQTLPYSSSLRAGLVEVPVTNATGIFVWEVAGEAALSLDAVSFAVSLAVRAESGAPAATMSISGGLAGSSVFAGPVNTASIVATPCLPIITSINPSSAYLASGGFTINIIGSGFSPQSTVRWNGSDRPTTYIGAGLLTAQIPASDLAAAGTANVGVYTPGAGTLSALPFTIRADPPAAPSSPSPADRSTGIFFSPILSWTGAGAIVYDVYFGTSPTPPIAGTVTSPGFPIGSIAPNTTYYWRVNARNASGFATSPVWRFTTETFVAPSLGFGFRTMTPCRIVDSRIGQNPLLRGTSRNVPVTTSSCNVPATARAYSLNVTAVPHEPLGYLTVWPQGVPQPFASTLNSFHGGVVANAAIVEAGSGGGIAVFATHQTDFVIDINGYFESGSGVARYLPLQPCRAADTRSDSGFTGTFGSPSLVPQVFRAFQLPSGACGTYPNAVAYALNATVVPKEPLGFLTMNNNSSGATSVLNSFDGTVVANAAIVPAGANGSVSAMASHATDLILDQNGVFLPSSSSGLQFRPLTPCRVADTRVDGLGAPVAAATKRDFPVTGRCGVPASAKAYSLNVTTVPLGPLGYLTLWPAGNTQPFVSTLNSFLARVVANAALIQAGAGGAVSAYVTDASHVILDVNGYFE